MARKVATFKRGFEVKLSKQRIIIMTYPEDIETIKTLIKSLYDELMKEMDEVRGDKDFYDGNKDETISEYTQMKEEAISTNSIEEAKAFATAIYDALVVEKIRTYAYKIYLESGINDYVQLASDIKDCYRIH